MLVSSFYDHREPNGSGSKLANFFPLPCSTGIKATFWRSRRPRTVWLPGQIETSGFFPRVADIVGYLPIFVSSSYSHGEPNGSGSKSAYFSPFPVLQAKFWRSRRPRTVWLPGAIEPSGFFPRKADILSYLPMLVSSFYDHREPNGFGSKLAYFLTSAVVQAEFWRSPRPRTVWLPEVIEPSGFFPRIADILS